MGRFAELNGIMNGIFGSLNWQSQDIATYPVNTYIVNDGAFIRFSILFDEHPHNAEGIRGMLMIEIYENINKGILPFVSICDKLDQLLRHQNVSGCQFFNSNFRVNGRDTDDPDLYRGTYAISFQFYGE